jgi:hypothetical protein
VRGSTDESVWGADGVCGRAGGCAPPDAVCAPGQRAAGWGCVGAERSTVTDCVGAAGGPGAAGSHRRRARAASEHSLVELPQDGAAVCGPPRGGHLAPHAPQGAVGFARRGEESRPTSKAAPKAAARLDFEVSAGWARPSSGGRWGGDALLLSTRCWELRPLEG